MGLFSTFKRIRRRVKKNVQRLATGLAPLAASIAPGPVGAAAKIFLKLKAVEQLSPTPFVQSSTGSGRAKVGLAGFAAQSVRANLGPQFRASQARCPSSLPTRSQFPFVRSESVGVGGFSAPFQAKTFRSGASGFRGAARSPRAFFGRNFQRRSVSGSRVPRLRRRRQFTQLGQLQAIAAQQALFLSPQQQQFTQALPPALIETGLPVADVPVTPGIVEVPLIDPSIQLADVFTPVTEPTLFGGFG